MELTAKNVNIHLSTPLMAINGYPVDTIKGKVIEKFPDGVLVRVESVEPKKEASKYVYSTIFVPTHKIDFIGVVS